MPVAVNEVLYDTSISLNRDFVFEFVKCLCICAPPKDAAQKRLVLFLRIFEKQEKQKSSEVKPQHGLGSLPGAHTSIRTAAGIAWHLFLCRGPLHVVHSVCVCGTRSPLLLGTCPCPLVVACGLALCAAPRPVWSLSVLWSAVLVLWCLSPVQELSLPDLLGGCAGHVEAGRESGSFCLPLAPAEAGAPGSLCDIPVQGPAMGLSVAAPSGFGPRLRALQWFAGVDPVTDASSFPYRLFLDGGLGRCTRAVSCGHRHLPLRVGGCHAGIPCVCAWVHSS